MMTLGMIEGWNEDAFKRVNERGLKAIELDYNVGNDAEQFKALAPDLKKWSEQYGVAVGAVGRWGSDKHDKQTGEVIAAELNDTKKLIDACKEIGCPVFITGCNYVESKSYYENCMLAVDWLKEIVDYAGERGIKVCTYNCHWNNFIDRPRAYEIIHGAIPALGIKFDPSHCVNEGHADYLAEMRDWGDRYYHVHIKGTINIGGCHVDDPPAGLDMVNWQAIMGMLYAKKYSGMLSIEPHSGVWRAGEQGEWGIQYTIKYIRSMMFDK